MEEKREGLSREEQRRAEAIRRIKEKRDFWTHVAFYVVTCGFLVVIWAVAGGDYFWPIWPILGWGLVILMHAGSLYLGNRPITEARIRREEERLG